MANSYFEFKQFTINQDQCAMKVGTDGVLLGAWVDVSSAKRILDVGAGTGLISLMMAQKSEAHIDAVEIDPAASFQAKENVLKSRWDERITVYNRSFQVHCVSEDTKYDLIVSNPPFFTAGPESSDLGRARARHNKELTLEELVECCSILLSEQGKVALVLPVEMRKELVSCIARYGIWIERETRVKPLPSKGCNRILFLLSKNSDEKRRVDELVVELGVRHEYSKEFKFLTKDFYKFVDDDFRCE